MVGGTAFGVPLPDSELGGPGIAHHGSRSATATLLTSWPSMMTGKSSTREVIHLAAVCARGLIGIGVDLDPAVAQVGDLVDRDAGLGFAAFTGRR